jgi:hypothetical protein
VPVGDDLNALPHRSMHPTVPKRVQKGSMMTPRIRPHRDDADVYAPRARSWTWEMLPFSAYGRKKRGAQVFQAT